MSPSSFKARLALSGHNIHGGRPVFEKKKKEETDNRTH